MNLLLDTHIFLWYIANDARLDSGVRREIQQPENHVYLSAVSIWECLVKNRLGKLPLPAQPAEYLLLQRKRHLIDALSLDEGSVSQLAKLPDLHRDPFDRMLICQAIEHNLTLVTVDEAVKQYPVAVFQSIP